MTHQEIIELAKKAGLYVANDSEGHFSGVTNEEIIDMYPDPDKERDRLFREKVFIEVLMPFAKLVAEKERERISQKIAQLPFGDTAQSFSIWVKNDT
jgi:hypothetical protein